MIKVKVTKEVFLRSMHKQCQSTLFHTDYWPDFIELSGEPVEDKEECRHSMTMTPNGRPLCTKCFKIWTEEEIKEIKSKPALPEKLDYEVFHSENIYTRVEQLRRNYNTLIDYLAHKHKAQ